MANAQWGPVYDVAVWLEAQPGVDATIVYVGDSADPSASEPTTLTLRPYGADTRPNVGAQVQRFQAIARGTNARLWQQQAYDKLAGLSIRLGGEELTIVPLQSAPVYLMTEDSGGTWWTLNYSMESGSY